MQNNQQLPNIPETAKAFTEITIKDFLKAIKKNRIGLYGKSSAKQESDKLRDSFKFKVRQADFNEVNILISFAEWGSFVEWGVGKGVTIDDVPILSKARGLVGRLDGQKRRPKKWYSKTIYYEVKKLSNILSQKFGIKIDFALDIHQAGQIDVTLF